MALTTFVEEKFAPNKEESKPFDFIPLQVQTTVHDLQLSHSLATVCQAKALSVYPVAVGRKTGDHELLLLYLNFNDGLEKYITFHSRP